jgi:molecular chaperone GrpE (heat shock protein)
VTITQVNTLLQNLIEAEDSEVARLKDALARSRQDVEILTGDLERAQARTAEKIGADLANAVHLKMKNLEDYLKQAGDLMQLPQPFAGVAINAEGLVRQLKRAIEQIPKTRFMRFSD